MSLACLEMSFVVKGLGAVILLFRLEYKTSVVCHNVNTQKVKIARGDRLHILAYILILLHWGALLRALTIIINNVFNIEPTTPQSFPIFWPSSIRWLEMLWSIYGLWCRIWLSLYNRHPWRTHALYQLQRKNKTQIISRRQNKRRSTTWSL